MKTLAQGMKKIKKAFPSLPADFYDILCERVKDHEFTDNELVGAINHVIDNCTYPMPTVANFISYNKDSPERVMKEKKRLEKQRNLMSPTDPRLIDDSWAWKPIKQDATD